MSGETEASAGDGGCEQPAMRDAAAALMSFLSAGGTPPAKARLMEWEELRRWLWGAAL